MVPLTQALKDAGWTKQQVDEIVLVGGSTRIPKIKEMLKEYFDGKTLNESVNVDEAVAYGATVQAGVLTGEKRAEEVLILDVIPLSLGIETVNGIMTPLIERNTMIPVKKMQVFSTASDNQPSVEINVYEGERPMAKDNHFLGRFHLNGIPLAPRGVPQIEVTFDVNANGILEVTAVEKATGKKEQINITSDQNRLNADEIKKMVENAEKNRAADQELKEKIEARAGLENYAYSVKTQLADDTGIGSKIDAADKQKVTALVEEKLKWLETNKNSASKEDFEEQKHEIEKVFGPIVSKLYGQSSGGAGAGDTKDAGEHEDL